MTETVAKIPQYTELMAIATSEAAANLEFLVGPWRSLHFCGNAFREVGGELLRSRDAATVISKVQCLFGAESS